MTPTLVVNTITRVLIPLIVWIFLVQSVAGLLIVQRLYWRAAADVRRQEQEGINGLLGHIAASYLFRMRILRFTFAAMACLALCVLAANLFPRGTLERAVLMLVYILLYPALSTLMLVKVYFGWRNDQEERRLAIKRTRIMMEGATT